MLRFDRLIPPSEAHVAAGGQPRYSKFGSVANPSRVATQDRDKRANGTRGPAVHKQLHLQGRRPRHAGAFREAGSCDSSGHWEPDAFTAQQLADVIAYVKWASYGDTKVVNSNEIE
jgi:hypothetical protein